MSFALDTFGGTASTALSAHTADSGATWSKHPVLNAGEITLLGSNDAASSTTSSILYLCSVLSGSTTYVAGITFTVVGSISASDAISVSAEINATVDTRYQLDYNAASGNWELYKAVAGAYTLLASVAATLTVGHSYTLKLYIAPGQQTATVSNNGGAETVILTASDSSVANTGRVGIETGGAVQTSSGFQYTAFFGVVALAPTNPGFLYSPGNWNVITGYAITVNPGAYQRTLVNAQSIALLFATSGLSTTTPHIWVAIDGGPPVQYTLASVVVVTPTLLSAGIHLVEWWVGTTDNSGYRWDMTQSSNRDYVGFIGMVLSDPGTITLPQRRPYTIWIFGDSITEGCYVLGNGSPLTSYSNVMQDWSWQVYRSLPAEVMICGFSGTGVRATGSAGVPNLVSSYNYIYNTVARPMTPAPNLVIYLEGTNDYPGWSGTPTDNDPVWVADMQTVINGIGYVNTQHLVVVPFDQNHKADIAALVASYSTGTVSSLQTAGVINLTGGDAAADNVHPLAEAHVGKMAPVILAAAATLLLGQTVNLTSTAVAALASALLATPANKLATDASGRTTLTPAEHTLISGTDVPAGLTTQGYTTGRAPALDRITTALPNAAPNASGGIATIGETGALLDATDIAAIANAMAPTDPTSNTDAWSSLGKAIAALLDANGMGGRKKNTGTPAAGTQVIQNKAGTPIGTATWTNANGVFDQEPAS